MTYKRYQYWTREGKQFTEWFPWHSDSRDPIQLKGYKGDHLRNEYKDEVEDIPKCVLEGC
jgi:hypothetical protein